MLRNCLILLLAIWLMPTASAKPELVLNLDDAINVQLLPNAEYLHDEEKLYDISTIKDIDEQEWTEFNRDQFMLGFTTGYVWVKTTFKTTGNQARQVALQIHQSMDSQTIFLNAHGEEMQQYSFGLGTEPAVHFTKNHSLGLEDHTLPKTKSDHAVIKLSPNKTYFLYLRSASANPVIGDFKMIDSTEIISHGKFIQSWLYIYLALALLIIIYCLGIFVISRDRAYLYHIGFMLSTIAYLLTESGSLSLWFRADDLDLLQNIIMLGLTGCLIFIMFLIKQMHAGFENFNIFIKGIYYAVFLGGLLSLLWALVFSYNPAIRFFIIVVVLAIPTALYVICSAYLNNTKQYWQTDYRTISLHIILASFVPLAFIHLLVKLGWAPVNILTNHILFLSVFIEIFMLSGVLLMNLRNSKQAFINQEVTNGFSLLPNDIALERMLNTSNFTAPVSLLQIWISGFDGLQTTLGTKVFCEFLQIFGQEAQNKFESTSLLCRTHNNSETSGSLFHSDQNTFVILCRQLNKQDQTAIVNIIESSINKAINQVHEHFDFKVSIGAHVFDDNQKDYDGIIQNSVLALSEGIKNGSPFTYFTDHIGFNEARRNRLITDFYHSLVNGEFFLLWQPQYDTVKNTISGVEVLARWNHRELGMIGPDEFIPLLEQSHRISDLTKWVINQVFKELPKLHESSGEVEVSINLSTRDLSNSDLIEMLDQKLETHRHLVPYITMEITESMMIDDYQVVLRNVNKLQQRGFKVSIDDFGSGYASFAYLQSLPANELKIDRCYTERFEEPRTTAILESVIALAKSLNMIIVVEGVESSQQVELFTKLGVHRLQGWAMGKPMSLDDLILKTS